MSQVIGCEVELWFRPMMLPKNGHLFALKCIVDYTAEAMTPPFTLYSMLDTTGILLHLALGSNFFSDWITLSGGAPLPIAISSASSSPLGENTVEIKVGNIQEDSAYTLGMYQLPIISQDLQYVFCSFPKNPFPQNQFFKLTFDF